METNSQTPKYKMAELHCNECARRLADQLLSCLNNTILPVTIAKEVRYPRQLILEKVVKLLTDQI